MMDKLWAFVIKDWRQARSYRMAFILQTVGLALPFVGLYFLGRLFDEVEMRHISQYGASYPVFLLTGVVVTSFSGMALAAAAGHLRTAQFMGTLEVLLLTKATLPVIILGGAFYSFLRSILRMVLYLTGGLIILNVSLTGANLWGAFLTVFLMVLVMGSMGLLAAGFTLVFKQGDPFTALMLVAAGLLSGTVYPVSVLPQWLQYVGQILPQTHAIEAVRLAVLQGYSLSLLAPHILALAIYAIVLMPLALIGFKYAMYRARVEGSLAHY
jgi:ABC-2 type transport system permease protein